MKNIAVLVALLAATAAQADTTTTYDFNADVQGWFANNFNDLIASVTYDSTDGSPSAGSLILQTTGSIGLVRSPCLPIPPGTTSISVSLISKSQQETPLLIYTFPVNCDSYDGSYTYNIANPSAATAWTSFDVTATLTASGMTAFSVGLSPQTGDIVHIDHVVLTTHGSTPVRLQSFGVD